MCQGICRWWLCQNDNRTVIISLYFKHQVNTSYKGLYCLYGKLHIYFGRTGVSPRKLPENREEVKERIYWLQAKVKMSSKSTRDQSSGYRSSPCFMSINSLIRSTLHFSLSSNPWYMELLTFLWLKFSILVSFVSSKMFRKLLPVIVLVSLLTKLNSCLRTYFGEFFTLSMNFK